MPGDISFTNNDLHLKGHDIIAIASEMFAGVGQSSACLSGNKVVALTGGSSAVVQAPTIKLDGDVIMTRGVTITVTYDVQAPDPTNQSPWILDTVTERVDLIDLIWTMKGQIAQLQRQVANLQSRVP